MILVLCSLAALSTSSDQCQGNLATYTILIGLLLLCISPYVEMVWKNTAWKEKS